MNADDNLELEMEAPLSILVEKPTSTKKNNVCLWLQRIVNLDDLPNQKHYRPVFIIVMCILHILIYLLTYINTNWRGQRFASTFVELFQFFIPCMRPASDNIRISIVRCNPWMRNTTCNYDDELKKLCFSFMYPHQLWRIVTVNLLHTRWYHLLFNLLIQLLYGIPLERKYGSVRIVIIYWLAELGSSLSFMVKNREKASFGASGALYGIMLFFTVDRFIAMQTNTGRRLFILMQLALLVLFPFVLCMFLAILLKLNVAHSAHFGGGLVGFLFGIGMFGCPLPWNNEHYICRTTSQYIAFVLLALYYAITLTMFFVIDTPIVRWIF